ncbi:MAG: SDR family oxidoreductase [Alphaproteobacteria bacterium]|nr:SDR family oxidoreductase [Alphaproteobacteria bacterium]MBT5158553.1 SDR family oxidoreductase [Alphaproteobacteria bacterium]MBT5918492.1 SDR family oxidoreductase [Alphaproteobacteria bacterium]MBT6386406.1 SDR family oxidoreductase [Alphaproteobacteria bacterium]
MTDTGLDLVTGGGGFIGSHLVDRLLADGRQVRVIDNFEVGNPRNLEQHKDNASLEVMVADIRDRDAIKKAFDGVDRVFHLAARADIVPSIVEPREYFESNVDGTFNVLEAARDFEISRMVYIASSSCYGIPDAYPTREDADIRPQYPYALTKYLGEQLALHWAQTYDLPIVSLRFFNVYGPRARTSGTYGAVFGVFLAQLLAGEPLTIVGDGEQTRDFTFVTDVVDAIVTAANSDASGDVFNVGSGASVSVNRLVELLGAEKTVNIPKRPGEPDCTLADMTHIKNTLGWTPSVPIEDGVRIMLENIDYWRDAPVWTPDQIDGATEDWFRYLGDK